MQIKTVVLLLFLLLHNGYHEYAVTQAQESKLSRETIVLCYYNSQGLTQNVYLVSELVTSDMCMITRFKM